jgi:hypothetical protein
MTFERRIKGKKRKGTGRKGNKLTAQQQKLLENTGKMAGKGVVIYFVFKWKNR